MSKNKSQDNYGNAVEEKLSPNDQQMNIRIRLTYEILEQLRIMNNTLEEIHDELHELTNRGSGF